MDARANIPPPSNDNGGGNNWSCQVCTFLNSGAELIKCEMCESPRSAAVVGAQSSSSSPPPPSEPEPQPPPAMAAVVEPPPSSEDDDNMDDGDECCICLEEFNAAVAELQRRSFQCTHSFHPECITEWLQQSKSCPMCRRILKPVEMVPPPDDDEEGVTDEGDAVEDDGRAEGEVDVEALLLEVRSRMRSRMKEHWRHAREDYHNKVEEIRHQVDDVRKNMKEQVEEARIAGREHLEATRAEMEDAKKKARKSLDRGRRSFGRLMRGAYGL